MEAQQTELKVRKLTVCYKGVRRQRYYIIYNYISMPIMSITRKWLEEMGFRGGYGIDIICEKRKLMVPSEQNQ